MRPVLFRHFEARNWEWNEVAGQFYLHRFLRHPADLQLRPSRGAGGDAKVVDFLLDMGATGLAPRCLPFLFEAEGSRCDGPARNSRLPAR